MDSNYPTFLKSLKVGDEVAIEAHAVGGRVTHSMTSILKITPTGRIRTKKYPSAQFINGIHRISSYDYDKIVPVTQPILDSILKSRLSYKLSKTNFSSLSLPQLLSITTIITEEKSKEEKEESNHD